MRKRAQNHSIEGAFVFMLLGLFAVMSTVLVLFGVQAYRNSISRSDANGEERLLTFYLRSMVRSMDERDVITCGREEGTDVLYLTEYYDGVEYVTRIYSYGGMLREYFTERGNEWKMEDGEELFPAESFTVGIRDGMLTADLKAGAGSEPVHLDIALYSGGGKGSAA